MGKERRNAKLANILFVWVVVFPDGEMDKAKIKSIFAFSTSYRFSAGGEMGRSNGKLVGTKDYYNYFFLNFLLASMASRSGSTKE